MNVRFGENVPLKRGFHNKTIDVRLFCVVQNGVDKKKENFFSQYYAWDENTTQFSISATHYLKLN